MTINRVCKERGLSAFSYVHNILASSSQMFRAPSKEQRSHALASIWPTEPESHWKDIKVRGGDASNMSRRGATSASELTGVSSKALDHTQQSHPGAAKTGGDMKTCVQTHQSGPCSASTTHGRPMDDSQSACHVDEALSRRRMLSQRIRGPSDVPDANSKPDDSVASTLRQLLAAGEDRTVRSSPSARNVLEDDSAMGGGEAGTLTVGAEAGGGVGQGDALLYVSMGTSSTAPDRNSPDSSHLLERRSKRMSLLLKANRESESILASLGLAGGANMADLSQPGMGRRRPPPQFPR
jgi:hypothetical protein